MDFKCLANHNPSSLQMFLENFDSNITALKRLNVQDLLDYILTYLAMSKLSQETINAFELVNAGSDDLPKYQDLIKFVRQQSRVVLKPEKRISAYPTQNKFVKHPHKSFFTKEVGSSRNCIACHKEPHFLKDCQTFKTWSFEQKFKLIKENNLCLNCFSNKHKVSACPSKFSCNTCRLKHHTLLHKAESTNNPSLDNHCKITEASTSTSINVPNVTKTYCAHTENSSTVLLGTVIVKITDKWNKKINARFLVDSGSMSNMLTMECCKKLKLPFSKLNSHVIRIGGFTNAVKGTANLTIHSHFDDSIKYQLEVLLVDKITNVLPDRVINTNALCHLQKLPLADPNFYNPGEIDGILGITIFTEIIGPNKIFGPVGSPGALETSLGYLVTGRVDAHQMQNEPYNICALITLEHLVEKMWNLENFTIPVHCEDDQICLKLYSDNVSRDKTGRYTVSLPFKSDPIQLGDSYTLAKHRFLALERKLETNLILKNTYHGIIQDYLNQGHLSLVPFSENEPSYYISHHCFFKPNSLSTPCRIVFDASMKTNRNISLNDVLYTGPKLQNNSISILINFRIFPIAVTSDIKQMYRQINVIKEHRKYQKILWRFDKDREILTYELNTVTFGINCSPFLSLKTIHQLVEDESSSYPDLVAIIKENMYMDDYVSSFADNSSALNIFTQMVSLFHAGGFEIVKWVSNSPEFMSQIPDHFKGDQPVKFDKDFLKILGVQWNHYLDTLSFKVEKEIRPCTKRNMLSLLARMYDPLGLISPITLLIKSLIKQLWCLSVDWDQPVPEKIEKSWCCLQAELVNLKDLNIPRHLFIFSDTEVSLVGFSDASQVGYAAVVYVRSVQANGVVNINFLFSQARVAPMSKITLPRLELCASVLLSRLLAQAKTILEKRVERVNIYAFSDSSISIQWINSKPYRWKTFISNRIIEIHKNLPNLTWKFVPGNQNVVDCASRGLTPNALLKHPTWLSGPSWLALETSNWPVKDLPPSSHLNDSSESISNNVAFVVSQSPPSPLYSLITYFSSWTKLLKSTAYVLQFLKIISHYSTHNASDLNLAEHFLIRSVQHKHFSLELKALSNGENIKSYVRKLNPFLKDGIIRVGGRLVNSKINYDHQHPILLPKSDPLVVLLVDYFHKLYCHTGAYLLHSLLRHKYWILSARKIIRQRIWKCNHCFKLNPKPSFPLMANLPTERINQAKAFLSTGVDFTGAFNITMSRSRGNRSQKAYVCLFICLATKAIHLELASSLSTDCFLAAFKRFLSRRGNCSKLFSDCGTNFVGAKRKLDEVYEFFQSKRYIQDFQRELTMNKIEWIRNPPSASHFGGIWEANIKCVKTHLSRIIGLQILSYEEFLTVLTQIEALLNSRPLCILSEDPNDPVALTPAHFLYGAPLNSFPTNVTAEEKNPIDRYKLLDSIVAHFWKRWHSEYLSSLQIRQKWHTPSNPVKEGVVVIIKFDNIPPLQWPIGIIEKVFPSNKDGVVRVVCVRTKAGCYTRPVAKLCPLPSQ